MMNKSIILLLTLFFTTHVKAQLDTNSYIDINHFQWHHAVKTITQRTYQIKDSSTDKVKGNIVGEEYENIDLKINKKGKLQEEIVYSYSGKGIPLRAYFYDYNTNNQKIKRQDLLASDNAQDRWVYNNAGQIIEHHQTGFEACVTYYKYIEGKIDSVYTKRESGAIHSKIRYEYIDHQIHIYRGNKEAELLKKITLNNQRQIIHEELYVWEAPYKMFSYQYHDNGTIAIKEEKVINTELDETFKDSRPSYQLTQFKYNAEGLLLEKTKYGKLDTIKETYVYEKGWLIKKTINNSEEEAPIITSYDYLFDERGNVIEIKTFDNNNPQHQKKWKYITQRKISYYN